MAEIISLSPSMLLLDPQNPRLAQPSSGQREILQAIAKEQKHKLVVLAKDIVEHGTNPGDLPYVTSAKDEFDRYIVLEGNRRLAALRGLENPELLKDALDGRSLAQLRRLSKEYQESPVDSLQCVDFKARKDADHWILLRHTGENDGAGIARWVSDQAGRFKQRASGSKEIHVQALDFLENQGALSPDERSKVPSTSLKRLLGTPKVREKIGVTLENGSLKLLAPERQVAKALSYIANDLAEKNTKTEHIYTEKQRIKYANQLPKGVVVKPTLKKAKAMNNGPAPAPARAKKVTRVKPRNHLIPRDCVMSITHTRIADIERELRSLSLEDHHNAVSVLLRVFIELSANVYVDAKGLSLPPNPKLRNKLTVAVDSLVAAGKLTNAQAKPVRAACQKNSFLAPTVDQLHDYIHNQDRFPAPSDLRATWGNFQPFMMAIWS